jgi:hypothetical protein
MVQAQARRVACRQDKEVKRKNYHESGGFFYCNAFELVILFEMCVDMVWRFYFEIGSTQWVKRE